MDSAMAIKASELIDGCWSINNKMNCPFTANHFISVFVFKSIPIQFVTSGLNVDLIEKLTSTYIFLS